MMSRATATRSGVGWRRAIAIALVALVTAAADAAGQFAMPDPREMAGIPRPVTDLPDRSISVRLVRGQLSNNISDHPVELHAAGGEVLTVRTDENGRAQFDRVAPGSRVHAVAVVDGERLESQEFSAPASGGVRLLLVATPPGDGNAPAPPPASAAGPAAVGEVTLGERSRFVIEPGDEGLHVYYVLDIVNPAQTGVRPEQPLVFEVPSGARSLTVLEGSSPQASASGSALTVTGPFQPGSTPVQAAFILPVRTGRLDLAIAMPVAMSPFTVIVRKLEGVDARSPQFAERRELSSDGQPYIVAGAPGLAAGEALTIELSGLPHHSRVPVMTALGLSGVIVAIGVWIGLRREDGGAAARRRQRLHARREQLFASLVKVEEQRRNGGDPARLGARRDALIAQLEQIYAELDAGASRTGGDEGLAA